jgi:hypothetical protein
MIDAKSFRRALLLTSVVAVAAAPVASARVADAPVHQSQPAVATTAVPARVDGIGQQPVQHAGRVATPIVRTPSHDGFDWTLAAVLAAGALSLVLLAAAGWQTRTRRLASH